MLEVRRSARVVGNRLAAPIVFALELGVRSRVPLREPLATVRTRWFSALYVYVAEVLPVTAVTLPSAL